MAAINFPSSPSLNDEYTENGKTYIWDGVRWVAQSDSAGGDVVGPASSINNSAVFFDGTSGKLLKGIDQLTITKTPYIVDEESSELTLRLTPPAPEAIDDSPRVRIVVGDDSDIGDINSSVSITSSIESEPEYSYSGVEVYTNVPGESHSSGVGLSSDLENSALYLNWLGTLQDRFVEIKTHQTFVKQEMTWRDYGPYVQSQYQTTLTETEGMTSVSHMVPASSSILNATLSTRIDNSAVVLTNQTADGTQQVMLGTIGGYRGLSHSSTISGDVPFVIFSSSGDGIAFGNNGEIGSFVSDVVNFGTAGQILTSNGSGSAVSWTTPTNGTVTSVSVTQPAAGLTVSGGPITSSGTFTFALADDLAAIEGLSSTGIAVRSAANTWVQRSISVSGTGLSLSNGDGVSGNPTITSNATSANTASTIVARDGSGNFTAGTITAALSGNATTATTLQTARTIGGVSFNGSADINLPGVNTTGNQNTSGSAATLTTTRTIWGQNFNGSANVTGAASGMTTLSMSGVLTNTVATGTAPFTISSTTRVANLNVATAGTADVLTTARTIGGVSFDGSANINLPGVNTAGNQNTTGSAATLTTTRTIWGQSFNGSANVTGAASGLTTLSMSGQLTNTLAIGTAPFVITSTTRVANLNVATAGTADTWTTGRTITIGGTGKSVNGSANVSWTLTEIGAVGTSGDETIAGVKTFSSRTVHAGAYTPSATPTHSATPTFDCSTSNVFEPAALTENVTSITMSNPVAGQTVQIRFQQDSTGGRTVAVPTGAKIDGSLNTSANRVSWLVMTYSSRSGIWEGNWMVVPT